MSKIIGEGIPAMLLLITATFSALLYNESTERKQLLAGMGLAIVATLCLEILLLQFQS